MELFETYTRKIKQMSAMTEVFWHRRVFDVYIPSRKGESTIAIGMVPYYRPGMMELDPKLPRDSLTKRLHAGVNDFDATPPRVNLKLRRNLLKGAKDSLLFYDGATQSTFKFPRADWKAVHCANPANKNICDLEQAFGQDYAEDMLIVAKRNITKGTVTGLSSAATTLDIATNDWFRLSAKNVPTKHRAALNEWMNAHGGETFSRLGDRVYISIDSDLTLLAHPACDGSNATMTEITHLYPGMEDYLIHGGGWDPVTSRIQGELDHVKRSGLTCDHRR